MTNRALLLAALAHGTSTLRGPLIDADDAQVMIVALRQLGATITHTPSSSTHLESLSITGVSGRWRIPPGREINLDLHNAGTATRFLAAAALLAPAGTTITIDGDARMRQRPIGELVSALNALTDPVPCVEFVAEEGFPPIRIRPERIEWVSGMRQVFGRTQSSQFVSAVLLLGPFLPHGLEVAFSTTDVTSRSYIDMTVSLLRSVGARVDGDVGTELRVHPSRAASHSALPAFALDIEPDASGATYFLAAAALFPGAKLTIQGLDLGPRGSLQGDTGFVSFLTAIGCRVERAGGLTIHGPAHLAGIDFDLSDMPDTAMTAAVLACFARGVTTLRGLRTLRVKETDRLAALQTELSKLGARVEILTDNLDESLRITPPTAFRENPITFDTYHDHRMAMALSLIGLRVPNISISNPGCVAKTYPNYWCDLSTLYAPD